MCVLVLVHLVGFFVSCFVFAACVGGFMNAYAVAFMHRSPAGAASRGR